MRTILVVDDEEPIRRTLDLILTRHGFQVVTADSGSEAVAVVGRGRIDLILSDIHMPGLPGTELLKYLHERQIEPPVVFMSGDRSAKTKALDIPGATFLSKPFTASDLLGAVTAKLPQ